MKCIATFRKSGQITEDEYTAWTEVKTFHETEPIINIYEWLKTITGGKCCEVYFEQDLKEGEK
jgi:hypothetical protein